MSVQILDDTLVNQIAAGEVVERPASVVKELIENSLDAGASSISVALSNGGISSIEVLDDGCGMSEADALLAIQRFGTSKITCLGDLQEISSLGFRGEALPSIASVSEFNLQTRANGQGVEVSLRGGEDKQVSKKDLPLGTRVTVRRLFFNTPARRRFLRTERTECSAIKNLVTDFSLAYPSRRFSLLNDGKELLSFSPVSSATERIRQLKLAGKSPKEVSYEFEGYKVEGLLSQPIEAAPNASKLRFVVNGRIVRDKLLLRAVRDAFGIFLKGGQYPSGALVIELPAGDLDVNVHPQKAEVRFAQPDKIFRLITRGVRKALEVQAEVKESYRAPMPFRAEAPKPFFFENAVLDNAVPSSPPIEQPCQAASSMRYVGQVFKCYLMLEGSESLALVDMHAAHERVRFFELKRNFLGKAKIATQGLLEPEVIEDASENLSLALEKLGFEVDNFGENSLVIRGVPYILAGVSARTLFDECREELSDAPIEKALDSVIARLACHSSIRSGRELEREEAYSLLEALEEAEASGYCPHGRPIIRYFSASEVESFFGRI